MRQYLHDFFEEFDYPQEACEALHHGYDAIHAQPETAAGFLALLKRYDEDVNSDMKSMLLEAAEFGKQAGVHEYTAKLLLSVCMTRRLREYYRSAGLNDEMWFLSMCDLKWKLIECRLVHGIWGSFVSEWFCRFFDMTRFAIGRLQFELIPFGREYEGHGVKLTPETQVINVHIPRTGGPLEPELVSCSYAVAAEFFKERFGLEQAVFVCHSWLLFPRNLEILSPASNIRRFMADFELIDQGEYENYNEVWRLYDTLYQGEVDALPQDSSFRRGYADWIRKGIRTGWGHGVYVYRA